MRKIGKEGERGDLGEEAEKGKGRIRTGRSGRMAKEGR
jgi:hypothetical protein